MTVPPGVHILNSSQWSPGNINTCFFFSEVQPTISLVERILVELSLEFKMNFNEKKITAGRSFEEIFKKMPEQTPT